MAHAHSTVENPVSEDAFIADRQRMFDGFCSATTYSVVGTIVLLALMGFFLL